MTHKVGLIGWPVEHSVSPAMHNAAFKALGLDWRYDPLPVMPGEVQRRIDALIELGYCGFNVTVPHKQAVMGLSQVDEIDLSVHIIGAANTLIVRDDGKLRAANTDWHGFSEDLASHGVEVKGRHCLILGTGGSAKGVAYALWQDGAAAITFASRDNRSIQDSDLANLASEIRLRDGWEVQRIGYDGLAEVIASAPDMLIINCTPVGMWPNFEPSPWPDGVPFPSGAILYDLIYNPSVTRLMQQASEAGAQVIGGLGMLVRQGALSFRFWTSIAPPIDVMEQAARQKLGIEEKL